MCAGEECHKNVTPDSFRSMFENQRETRWCQQHPRPNIAVSVVGYTVSTSLYGPHCSFKLRFYSSY